MAVAPSRAQSVHAIRLARNRDDLHAGEPRLARVVTQRLRVEDSSGCRRPVTYRDRQVEENAPLLEEPLDVAARRCEHEDLLRASFGESYDRLREIKGKYDPENVFGSNLNIPPT